MEISMLENKKSYILKNINYAKKNNINKVSAILVCDGEELKRELLTWLIYQGYKVSLDKDDIDTLTIEW